MASRRIGGIIELKVGAASGGEGAAKVQLAKGNFTYNIGVPKKEMVVGADEVHGYKETPQVAMIEGAITDLGDFKLDELLNTVDATIYLRLANGKQIVISDAVYAGDGNVTTEEGEIEVKFEGRSGKEVAP